jgi:hypothetical protein
MTRNFLSRVRQQEYESGVIASYCKVMNTLSFTSTPDIRLADLIFMTRDNFPFTTSCLLGSVLDFECSRKITQGTGFEPVRVQKPYLTINEIRQHIRGGNGSYVI